MNMLGNRKNLVLIGMPSCGKSTIADIIHRETGMPCMEMDAVLVEEMGMTIKEAFAMQGEKWFRDHETDLCRRIGEMDGFVVSCGGGVVIREENMCCLKKNSIVVWIDRRLENLHGASDRPLVNSDEKIRQLYEERAHLYAMYSDFRVENNGNPETAAHAVLALLSE